jgi:urease accessory protein
MATTTDRDLARLMTWLSPSFPIGAFTYSHGLEYAVEEGLVSDRIGLIEWVTAILTQGAGRNDAILLCHAWRADDEELINLTELAGALRGTAEMALESDAQGANFLATVQTVWPHTELARRRALLEDQGLSPAYCVAVGIAAAVAGIDLQATVVAYLQALAANLVSAAVRLVPLGQTDGQRSIATLEGIILDLADEVTDASLDDLGSAAVMVDWTSMKHETQYTRLFRS